MYDMTNFYEWKGWSAAGVISTFLIALVYTIITYFLWRTALNAIAFNKIPSLKVVYHAGIMTYDNGEVSPPVIIFRASNDGGCPVTITSFGVRLPNKKTMFFQKFVYENKPLPVKLDQSEKYENMIYKHVINETLKEEKYSGDINLMVVFTDGVGNEHTCECQLNVDKEC